MTKDTQKMRGERQKKKSFLFWDGVVYTASLKTSHEIINYILCKPRNTSSYICVPSFLIISSTPCPFFFYYFFSLSLFFVSPTSLLGNQMNTVSQTNSVGFWPLDQTTVLTNISISLTLRDVSLSPHSINYDFSDLGWFH